VSSASGSRGTVATDVVATGADVQDRLVLLDAVLPELRRLQRRGLSAHVEPDAHEDRLRFRIGGAPGDVPPAVQLLAVQVRAQLFLHPGVHAPPELIEAVAAQLGDPVQVEPVDAPATGRTVLRDRLLDPAVEAWRPRCGSCSATGRPAVGCTWR